jgi:hypothetical protein
MPIQVLAHIAQYKKKRKEKEEKRKSNQAKKCGR